MVAVIVLIGVLGQGHFSGAIPWLEQFDEIKIQPGFHTNELEKILWPKNKFKVHRRKESDDYRLLEIKIAESNLVEVVETYDRPGGVFVTIKTMRKLTNGWSRVSTGFAHYTTYPGDGLRKNRRQ